MLLIYYIKKFSLHFTKFYFIIFFTHPAFCLSRFSIYLEETMDPMVTAQRCSKLWPDNYRDAAVAEMPTVDRRVGPKNK